ncbi:MAG: DNA-processing protein DprA [Steroidobacterales bacterium]
MPTSRELLSWVTLTRTPGINVAGIATALDSLGQAAGVLDAPDQLRARAGLSPAAREYLQSPEAEPTAAERAWLESPRHHLLAFNDARFPPALRAVADCPVALYVDGNPDVLSDAQLAIVGSRNPTAQGRQTAFDFAQYLAQRGLVITSGLAQGIDTEAHRGALAGGGLTIGVLGTGVDWIYPRSNGALADQIAASGALVSEFPLGTPAHKGNFPQRNRIIAALALGTLVVEAARYSGSLITARLAGEAGREVFAIPGSIHNPLARGCHQLIRQGAKLTETADDILTELDFSSVFGAGKPPAPASAAASGPGAGMDKDHKILLDALGFDPTDLDMLVARTGFNAQAVSSMMLILELEGHVQAAPGGRYSRVSRSP